MAEMENFKKDFVKRTIDVLNKTYNDSEYEVTLLLNCLCGMVTLPIETEKYDQKMEIDLFKEKCVKKLESLCLYSNFYKRSYYNTFIDIRNSMAHFNIEVSNTNKRIEKIKLKSYIDIGNYQRHKLAFSITISVENLKKFAEYVATEYLKLI